MNAALLLRADTTLDLLLERLQAASRPLPSQANPEPVVEGLEVTYLEIEEVELRGGSW
jgi:hypothetical protein